MLLTKTERWHFLSLLTGMLSTDIDLVKVLVENGADVNHFSEKEDTSILRRVGDMTTF